MQARINYILSIQSTIGSTILYFYDTVDESTHLGHFNLDMDARDEPEQPRDYVILREMILRAN